MFSSSATACRCLHSSVKKANRTNERNESCAENFESCSGKRNKSRKKPESIGHKRELYLAAKLYLTHENYSKHSQQKHTTNTHEPTQSQSQNQTHKGILIMRIVYTKQSKCHKFYNSLTFPSRPEPNPLQQHRKLSSRPRYL